MASYNYKVCPNPECLYRWESRVASPLVCPKCHSLLNDEAKKQKNLRTKLFARKHYIGTEINGEHVILKAPYKREYTESCQLCGKTVRLVYHHWNDDDPNKGLWLCFRCHGLAESIDKNPLLPEMYRILKRQVESELNDIYWELECDDTENKLEEKGAKRQLFCIYCRHVWIPRIDSPKICPRCRMPVKIGPIIEPNEFITKINDIKVG
jgi:hypothetical protein